MMDNMSTGMMLFFVIIIMMFLGHVPKDLMFKGLLSLAAVGFLVGTLAVVLPEKMLNETSATKRLVTVKHRIERKFHLNENDDVRNSSKTEAQILLNDENSQTTYASIAIANSDVIGLGPGNSIQRDFLQHAESDFIYAIIIEETGIFGLFGVMFLYLLLMWQSMKIASRCKSRFPSYLVMGLSLMIVIQAMVNMAVATGAFPVTGQPLPLISRGGTSTFVNCAYFGMILSVSRTAKKKEEHSI
jgi:cell division protein FtsW